MKNDLGVDCISRADAERILTDLYHSDICDYYPLDILEDIKALPSVTPQEPKTGHWIKEESIYGWDGHSYQCSKCGRSIHLDTIVEGLIDYPYCHCGAKMVEPQESEDKK